jgi:hypothetical protein
MVNLKEAIRKGELEQFIAEHGNDPPGDERKFDAILRRAVETPKEARRASSPAADASCTDTQTRQRTSEGASPKRRRASRGSSS